MTTDVKCECRYQGLCSCDLCAPEPADRTILRWMPVAYIEAARAGVGKPDALRVAEGFTHRRSPAHADDEATANAGVDPITPHLRERMGMLMTSQADAVMIYLGMPSAGMPSRLLTRDQRAAAVIAWAEENGEREALDQLVRREMGW